MSAADSIIALARDPRFSPYAMSAVPAWPFAPDASRVLWANAAYRADAERLLALVRARDLGCMVIKAWTKGPWGERARTYDTWYEPFDDAPSQAVERSRPARISVMFEPRPPD